MAAAMTAALMFQVASLLASVAMVPLLLGFLGPKDYLLWTVFTTLGGLTLQLELAIQTLAVRRMAAAWTKAEVDELQTERRRAGRAYIALSLAVLLVVIPAGWIYLRSIAGVDEDRIAPNWAIAWLAFSLAYALNYLFGPNNVLLLSTARTGPYFWIAFFTRLLNVILTAAALVAGLGLVGVAGSFLLSVIINVLAIRRAAKTLRTQSPPTASGQPTVTSIHTASSPWRLDDHGGLSRYILFTVIGYALYRGAFLLAAQYLSIERSAGYGLALQAFAILFAIAVVPTTVWLHRIVAAIAARTQALEDREMARACLFALAAVAGGGLALILVGPFLLELIGSEVALPAAPILAFMGLAFLCEALILIIVNSLLVRGELGFIRPYVLLAGSALTIAAVAIWFGAPPLPLMLVLPFFVQSLLTLPILAGKLAKAQERDLSGLVRGISGAMPMSFGKAS